MTKPIKSPTVYLGRGYSVQFTLQDTVDGVAVVGAEWSPSLPKLETRAELMAGDVYRAYLMRFAHDLREANRG